MYLSNNTCDVKNRVCFGILRVENFTKHRVINIAWSLQRRRNTRRTSRGFGRRTSVRAWWYHVVHCICKLFVVNTLSRRITYTVLYYVVYKTCHIIYVFLRRRVQHEKKRVLLQNTRVSLGGRGRGGESTENTRLRIPKRGVHCWIPGVQRVCVCVCPRSALCLAAGKLNFVCDEITVVVGRDTIAMVTTRPGSCVNKHRQPCFAGVFSYHVQIARTVDLGAVHPDSGSFGSVFSSRGGEGMFLFIHAATTNTWRCRT